MRRYEEHEPPASLRRHAACIWTVTGSDGARRVLPDGCVDLVWGGGRLRLVGPMTRPLAIEAGADAAGVRLRPGAARLLGLPASELVDLQVDAGDGWGREAARLAERLAACGGMREAGLLLAQALDARLDGAPPLDPLVGVAVREIATARGPRVAELGRELYLSERQLRRRFLRDVGLGPAAFGRVARLQRLLRLATAAPPGTTVARLAVEAGYADEPHLAHDARSLAGLTPRRLLAEHAA